MSNLYKSAYVVQNESESRVIDSNEMVAKKIQMLTEIMEAQMENSDENLDYDGFVEGLNAQQVETLLEDPQEDAAPPSLDNQIESAKEELEQLRLQADAVIEDAKANARELMDKAGKDADKIRDDARQAGYNEGYEKGYGEGLEKAKAAEDEFLAKEELRQQEYEAALNEIEPKLVSTLCDIYEHVLGVELAGRSDIVIHLLRRALRTIEGGINYLVHVSSDDHEYAVNHKEELTSLLGSTNTLEIIEDITLAQGQSFIETESGIYDCSFGVEMELLKKEIILLSREDS